MDPILTIYGQPDCRRCKMLMQHALRKGVPFRYIDVAEDPKAKAHIKALGYLSVPVAEVGDEHWGGLKFTKIDELVPRLSKAS
ncbi:glutaredoxin family protein [Brachybacterium kimchii]|uniref:Glutaredoxin family protein n=1 Tax=Brachybacterium kimchii TaxID=2942909 RepID=A0ABY4NB67_9MICO|nr:glutaredoxin family protein [Brachybacterium kimchii]UQN31800.1 glutaredoxin family protein [Brachybacterium kimchii]